MLLPVLRLLAGTAGTTTVATPGVYLGFTLSGSSSGKVSLRPALLPLFKISIGAAVNIACKPKGHGTQRTVLGAMI